MTAFAGELRALDADRTLLVTPDGQLLEVALSAAELTRLLAADDEGDRLDPVVARLLDVASLPGPARPLDLRGDPQLTGWLGELVEPGGQGPVIRVALLRWPDEAALRALDAELHPSGAAVAFFADRGRCWFGPVVRPGRAPDLGDLLGRRRAALGDDALHRALHTTPHLDRRDPTAFRSGLAVMAAQLELLRRGRPSAIEDQLLVWDPAEAMATRHHLAPLPGRTQVRQRPVPPAELVSPEIGIVRSVRTEPGPADLPAGFVLTHTELPAMRVLDPGWANDVLVQSATLNGMADAAEEGLLAGVAHYCSLFMGQGERRRAAHRSFAEAGRRAVDPDALVLHPEETYQDPGSPLTRFGTDLEVSWLAGRSLRDGARTWVPASLVHLNWSSTDALGADPVTHFHHYPGLAAGRGRDEATAAALYDVIATDALAIWWAGREPLPALPIPDHLRPAAPVRLELRALPTTLDVPAVLAVVRDDDADLLVAAAGSGASRTAAATRAATGAYRQLLSARDLLDPAGTIRAAGRLGTGEVPVTDFRPDRSYRRAYRDDLRDVVDPMCHLELHLDPAVHSSVTGAFAASAAAPVPATGVASLAELVERIGVDGFDPVAVDVTTTDVAPSGLRVVRVVVPGLAPTYPAAFPVQRRGRLTRARAALGLAPPSRAQPPFPGWQT